MSPIPIAIIIVKLTLTFGLMAFGIRCYLVKDPKKDSFVYDIKNFIHIKGMSRRRFWRRHGLLLFLLGSALGLKIFVF